MTVVNRTNDFKRAVSTFTGAQETKSVTAIKNAIKPSDFSKVTSTLSASVHSTSIKLQNLTQLVKKKSLFDDKTEEINSMTVSIKDDITYINSELEKLEDYVRNHRSGTKQNYICNQNIVGALKDELIDTTKEFKDVLQLHHHTMESTQQRKQKLGASQPNLLGKPLNYSAPTDSVSITIPDITSDSKETTSTPLLTPSSFSLQDSQVISNRYIQDRSQAVTDIESNMVQLGSIFERLTTMITEQGEMIDRIDDNIDRASMNVNSGYQEIVKYGQSILSNRQLILKLFAVLIIFIIFFIIFFA